MVGVGGSPLFCASSGKCRSGEPSGVPADSAPGDCEAVPPADRSALAFVFARSLASDVFMRRAVVTPGVAAVQVSAVVSLLFFE